MKYGMNLLLWTAAIDETHDGLLESIKQWGYDNIEIPMFDFEISSYERLGGKLKELELGATAVTVCTPEENPISPEAAIRNAGLERLKKAIDACHAAGATGLCGPIHSALGEFSGAGATTDEWGWAQETLAQAADYGQQAGVKLIVEYLNRFECYFLNCAEDTARFCREVNHPNLKMMYDTFHANIEEKSVTEAIKACADQMVHVHISENDRSTPGEGDVKWEETFAALKEVGYDDLFVIEAFGLAMPELAAATKIWRKMYPSEEHLAQEGLKFMKSSWESA